MTARTSLGAIWEPFSEVSTSLKSSKNKSETVLECVLEVSRLKKVGFGPNGPKETGLGRVGRVSDGSGFVTRRSGPEINSITK